MIISATERRVKALKKIQYQYTLMEAQFYKEMHALEMKYDAQYADMYRKRHLIVSGEYEPNDEECDFEEDDDDDYSQTEEEDEVYEDVVEENNRKNEPNNRDAAQVVDGADGSGLEKALQGVDNQGSDWCCVEPNGGLPAAATGEAQPDNVVRNRKGGPADITISESPPEVQLVNGQIKKEGSGIPEFWLTVFRNSGKLSEMTQEYDENVLRYLEDVRIKLYDEPMGFDVEFHFGENEFFTNTVLTKHYDMTCIVDDTDPFCFDGPEVVCCKGTTIDWKPHKNVTMKTVRKKQKHKTRGVTRRVTKTVQRESFFNFFSPPNTEQNCNEGSECDDEEEQQAALDCDYEVGLYFRDSIVPRAVLYYTGEAVDDEEESSSEEEEDGSSNEDSDSNY